MKPCAIATISGDRIGKEVIPAGQQVLRALAAGGAGHGFDMEHFGRGGDRYRAPSSGLRPTPRCTHDLSGNATTAQVTQPVRGWLA